MYNRIMRERKIQSSAAQELRTYAARCGKALSGPTAALRSSTSVHLIALLVLPILLVWINNSIIFNKRIGVDASVYSGLHLHLPEFLRGQFGDTYYASRIPWNALGYAAHRLFDAEYALYAEHIFVFYIAVFSLYAAVSAIFANRTAAFAAAMLLGTNSSFLLTVGWDYVDGSYTACLLLGLAMMAGAAFWRRWRLAAMGWGAAVALTVSLYVLWIILLPIEIGLFFCLNRLGARRSIYFVAAFAIVGAAATTACLGVISWLAGGKPLYFLPQITSVPAVAANRFRWDVPFSYWVWYSEFLLVPAAVWLFSALWTAWNARPALRKLRSPKSQVDVNSRLWIACVFCIGAFLLFAALQVAGFHMLDFDDKARAQLPFVFVVLGGVLAVGMSDTSERHKLLWTLTVVALTMAPWVASRFDLLDPQPSSFMGPTAVIFWVGAGFLILWMPFGRNRLKYLLVTLFFSLLGFATVDTDWISFPPDPLDKEAKLAVFDASREISPYNPNATARFWFDAEDPIFATLRAVVSTYLYEYSLINENFPSLTDARGKTSPIAPGDRIIILTSSGEDPLPAANRAVADKNLALREVAAKKIRREGFAFMFIVADVIPAESGGVHCRSSLTPALIDKISLGSLKPENGASISAGGGTLVLGPPPKQWAYGASVPLPLREHASGSGLVCVRLQVEEGKLGIGILAHDDTSQMLTEEPVGTTSAPIEIELELADVANAGSIVLRSWSPNGVSVKARIYSIELRTAEPK